MINNKSVYKKPKKQINKNIKKLIFTQICIMSAYVISSLAVCLLMFTAELPEKSIYFIVLCGLLAASLFGGYLSGKLKMKNGLLNGILYCCPYIIIFLFVSLVLNEFKFDYKLLISLLSMLLTSASGGVLAVNKRKKSR